MGKLKSFIGFLGRDGNWRFAIMIGLFAILVPSLSYRFLTMDPDLYYSDRFDKLEGQLWSEMRALQLPPKTVANREENWSKAQSGIIVATSYRTELPADQFESQLLSRLTTSGWIKYEPARRDISDAWLCRGKLRASVVHEGVHWLTTSDNGDYWKLEFSYAPDSDNMPTPVPAGCTRS